jgi:hypothetical protein
MAPVWQPITPGMPGKPKTIWANYLDIRASGVSAEKFGLFMSFGLDFLDGYGRLLCYLNSGRVNFSDPATARAVTR